MAQFDIHENTNPASRSDFPYLIDVQSGLFAELQTRVVIPLACLRPQTRPLTRLTPLITVRGEAHILMTPQLAGVGIDALGERIADAAEQRDLIVQALDFLLTGS